MSAQSFHTAPQDNPGQPADPHGYREALHDLITMGTDFARLLHGQATAHAQAAPPTPTSHDTAAQPAPAPNALISLAAAFDRTARAVRRSILLARSLAKPVQPAQDPARHRAAARRRIIREVEDAIQRPSDTAERLNAEALQAELRDRFDAPDLDDDISTRPVADIITELCRDLGLAALPGARPWKRRTPEDIRQLHARAAAPTPIRPPGTGHQVPSHDATKRPLNPQPDQRAPVPRAQLGPANFGNGPLEYPTEATPMVPCHPTRIQGR